MVSDIDQWIHCRGYQLWPLRRFPWLTWPSREHLWRPSLCLFSQVQSQQRQNPWRYDEYISDCIITINDALLTRDDALTILRDTRCRFQDSLTVCEKCDETWFLVTIDSNQVWIKLNRWTYFAYNSKCSSQIGLSVVVFTAVLYLLVGADSR